MVLYKPDCDSNDCQYCNEKATALILGPTANETLLHLICIDGFSFDSKEVFILLLRHVGRARIGVNLKATCQKAARQPVNNLVRHYTWRKLPSFV